MRDIWFESHGTRLYAAEHGDGPPVVLLHGGLANHLACWRFAEPLAARYRVITPDARAAGKSIHAGPLSWDLLADDVAALLRHLDLPDAAIGGISSGSAIAIRTALRHSAMASSLILLTPAFGGADVPLAPAQQAAMDAMNTAAQRALVEGRSALLPLFDALPPAIRERAHLLVQSYDLPSVAATTSFLASGAQPFTTAADLAAIGAPTLLVPGTDPQHPAEIAELYRRHLRDPAVRTGDFAAAIADFLG